MDLRTTYLGLELKNPLVSSASPLSKGLDTLRQLEDAGAGAVVLHSLFEEEISQEGQMLDRYLTEGTESFAESLSFFPEMAMYESTRPDAYLEHLRKAKEALSIPVIASLNGVSAGGWTHYAQLMEQAGADALELNMYHIPTNVFHRPSSVEDMYTDLIFQLNTEIKIPLAVKLHPFFSSLPYTAQRFARAGVRGLVLFNRFYQPDIDIENLEIVPHLVLSNSNELLLPLRWIAILYGQVQIDLALTTGVHTAVDVIKGLMAGASVTMMASALLRRGPAYLGQVLSEMETWLVEHEYESVEQLQGSMSQVNSPNPAALERANYMRILKSFKLNDWREG